MESKNSNLKIRINKIISRNYKSYSLRKAEKLIKLGQVYVNNKKATLGLKVDCINDNIKINNKLLSINNNNKENIVLVLNKPRGLICTNYDPKINIKNTVFKLLPSCYKNSKLFCAGRLDKDTEGLLILTNNGYLANFIMHPSNKILKRYFVKLNKPFEKKDIKIALKGVIENEELLNFYKLKISKDIYSVEVFLYNGKKRAIRRLLHILGYSILILQRLQIGNYTMSNLKIGEYKKLSQKMIKSLKTSTI